MYVDDVVRMVIRRWPILLLGLALTAGLVGAAMFLVPPSYETRSQVLLVPPVTEQGPNPFLSLRALEGTPDVLSRAAMSQAVMDRVTAAGGSEDYEVVRDALVTGPLLTVTATGASPLEAERTMELLLEEIPAILDSLQEEEKIAEEERIVSSVLSQQDEPSTMRKDQIRAGVVAFVLGVMLTLGAAALVESRARRRESRVTAPPPAATQDAGPTSAPVEPQEEVRT